MFLLSVDNHTLNILVRELYGQEIINYYKAVFKTLLECYFVTRNKPIKCSAGKIKYNQQRWLVCGVLTFQRGAYVNKDTTTVVSQIKWSHSFKKSVKIIIDLARAKSEALDNIYGLFKKNIKSCNAKRRRQRRRMVKNNNRSN